MIRHRKTENCPMSQKTNEQTIYFEIYHNVTLAWMKTETQRHIPGSNPRKSKAKQESIRLSAMCQEQLQFRMAHMSSTVCVLYYSQLEPCTCRPKSPINHHQIHVRVSQQIESFLAKCDVLL